MAVSFFAARLGLFESSVITSAVRLNDMNYNNSFGYLTFLTTGSKTISSPLPVCSIYRRKDNTQREKVHKTPLQVTSKRYGCLKSTRFTGQPYYYLILKTTPRQEGMTKLSPFLPVIVSSVSKTHSTSKGNDSVLSLFLVTTVNSSDSAL